MKEVDPQLCPGCDAELKDSGVGIMEIGVLTRTQACEQNTLSSYCGACADKIVDMDLNDLSDDLDIIMRGKLKKPISISEELVREIARNLGATSKVEEALVEGIFGKNWTGPPPKESGLVMNRYQNRDRLVAFVADRLKNLWTLES